MHLFTSITTNYLPKARVLASSVKRFNPDCRFHLLLSDRLPDWFDLGAEPFDSVIGIEELNIPDFEAWTFKHSVVELCTAVKGFGFQEIMKRHGPDGVIYFDPDIAVFSSLDPLRNHLREASVLLTPHQTVPETSHGAIVDNEICSLKHGVYNLGFLAVRNSEEGRRLIDWWSDRLRDYCYDDICGGLFTDQRWIDLAPAFFEDIRILREPNYNLATWNLTHREARGSLHEGIRVNGLPLCFYHFSGFDSGAQEVMLNKYLGNSLVLKDLRSWYIEECRKNGQEWLGNEPARYNFYDNGETVEKKQRVLYRSRQDLQRAFPDPYRTREIDRSYYHWYRVNVGTGAGENTRGQDSIESLRSQLSEVCRELNTIKQSRSWRLVRKIAEFRQRLLSPYQSAPGVLHD